MRILQGVQSLWLMLTCHPATRHDPATSDERPSQRPYENSRRIPRGIHAKKHTTVCCFVLACQLVVAAEPVASSKARVQWHLGNWSYRRPVTLALARRDGAVGFVSFATNGKTRADGQDIRVICDANGQDMQRRILQTGPGDKVSLVFARFAGATNYHVYFGNPNYRASTSSTWTPKAGVILETWEKPQGPFNNWAQARTLFKKATKKTGSSLRPKIWDGANPHGQQDNYLARYTAYFRITEPGHYEFCTTSDDASFVFIDEAAAPVCQWPGVHRAQGGMWGKYSGRVYLESGVHRVQYFHVEGKGSQAAVLGWKRPRDPYPHLVEDRDFVGISQGIVGQTQTRLGKIEADFDWEIEGHWSADGYYLVAVNFVGAFGKSGARAAQATWDFGDQSGKHVAETSSMRHLYLQPGDYEVFLRVNGKTLKQQVNVHPKWDQMEAIPKQTTNWLMAAYPSQIAKHKDPKGLIAAFAVAMALGNRDVAAVAADALQSVDLHALSTRSILDLALFYQDPPFADAARSESLFELALKDSGHPRQRSPSSLHFAGFLIALQKDLPRAQGLLDDVTRNILSKDERRLYDIYRGDLAASLGNTDEAAAIYQKAGTTINLANTRRSVAHEGRLLAVRSYLDHNKLKEAASEIKTMQWEIPSERIDPDTLLLEAAVYKARGQLEMARGSLVKIAASCPNSARMPEVLFALVEVEKSLNNDVAAKARQDELSEKYPYTPEAARLQWILDSTLK